MMRTAFGFMCLAGSALAQGQGGGGNGGGGGTGGGGGGGGGPRTGDLCPLAPSLPPLCLPLSV